MRKSVAALLFLAYALTNTELGQLLKLPLLVDHFQQHRQVEKELAFIDFLLTHYEAGEPDADYEQDMKLPFKKPANPGSLENLFLAEKNIETELTVPVVFSALMVSLSTDKIREGEPGTLLRPPCLKRPYYPSTNNFSRF
jgi:hypothetical protein